MSEYKEYLTNRINQLRMLFDNQKAAENILPAFDKLDENSDDYNWKLLHNGHAAAAFDMIKELENALKQYDLCHPQTIL